MKNKRWIPLNVVVIVFVSINLFSSSFYIFAAEKGASKPKPIVFEVVPSPTPETTPAPTSISPATVSSNVVPKPQKKPLPSKVAPKVTVKPQVTKTTPQVLKPPVHKPSPQIKPSVNIPTYKPTTPGISTKPRLPASEQPIDNTSGREASSSNARGQTQHSSMGVSPASAVNTGTSEQRAVGGRQKDILPEQIHFLKKTTSANSSPSSLQRAFGKPAVASEIRTETGTRGRGIVQNDVNNPANRNSDIGKKEENSPDADHTGKSTGTDGKGILSGRPLTEGEKDRVRKLLHLPEGTEFRNFNEATWESKKIRIRKTLQLPAHADFATIEEAVNQTDVIKQQVRTVLGIPEDVQFTSAIDAVKFVEEIQEVGGNLTDEDWHKWGQGGGNEVVNDALRESLGIPSQGTAGMTKEELLGLGQSGQELGVESITPDFIDDWRNTQDGTLSGEDMINKWGYGADGAGDIGIGTGSSDSGTGSSGSNPFSGSSTSGSPDRYDIGLPSNTSNNGFFEGGESPGSLNGTDFSSGSNNSDGKTGSNNTPGSSENGLSTGASINPENDDSGTRDITPDSDVVDMDMDSPLADSDHNDYGNSSSSTTSTANTTGNTGGTDTNAADSMDNTGSLSETAASFIENNDDGNPDTGIFTVEGHDSSLIDDSFQGGRVDDVYSEGASSSDGYAEDDSGVVVGWGMTGPDHESDSTSTDSSSGNTDAAGSSNSGSGDTGSNDSGSDDSGSDDSGSGDSGSDDSGTDDNGGGDDSGNDDTGTSDSDDSDNGGSSNSSEGDSGNTESSADQSSGDQDAEESGRPNPMADEQGGGPPDPYSKITHDGKAVMGQPGPDGRRSVDASQLTPINPDELRRRGEEEVIHTTGDESGSDVIIDMKIPITGASVEPQLSNSRGGIELPSEDGDNAPLGTDMLPGHSGDQNGNPGNDGDPRADND